MSSSANPRRSARLAAMAAVEPVVAQTPARTVAVAAPAAPKKGRSKQPSARAVALRAERAELLAFFQAAAAADRLNSKMDTNITIALQDLDLVEQDDGSGRNQAIETANVRYLFEDLFADDNFFSLAEHHHHTDKMFHVLQRVHSGEIQCDMTTRDFIEGNNRISLFLYEVGFKIPNEFFL